MKLVLFAVALALPLPAWADQFVPHPGITPQTTPAPPVSIETQALGVTSWIAQLTAEVSGLRGSLAGCNSELARIRAETAKPERKE